MAITEQERKILGHLAALILTVKESGPEGAPSGICYTAFMQHGYSLEQYQGLVAAAKRTGMVRESGHVLYYQEIQNGPRFSK